MTDHSERNDPQPYNRAEEQPSTTRPVVQIESPYASTRGSITTKQLPPSMKRLSINTTVQGHATRLIQPL